MKYISSDVHSKEFKDTDLLIYTSLGWVSEYCDCRGAGDTAAHAESYDGEAMATWAIGEGNGENQRTSASPTRTG